MDTIPQIENTGDTIPGTVSAADTVTAPFDPSNDSLVGSKQIIHWLSCNPILDSLARIYLDSFRTNDHRLQAKYQQQFKRAQDSVCRKQGLRGGYDEYEWVLKNAGNKKNKALFDSLKILIFN